MSRSGLLPFAPPLLLAVLAERGDRRAHVDRVHLEVERDGPRRKPDAVGAAVRGALELAACYRFFPLGTVFLVVVDPGVGSSRRGLAADTGDYRFVAPDNGVLTGVFRATPPKRVVELTQRKFAVTAEGVKALRASRKALLELWSGLDEILSES